MLMIKLFPRPLTARVRQVPLVIDPHEKREWRGNLLYHNGTREEEGAAGLMKRV